MENDLDLNEALEHIEHMLFHALTEKSISDRLDKAKSQQEVYTILKELPYFSLSMEEFRLGIEAIQRQNQETEH